ncbi:hypothetical protein GCM10010371_06900 [Streptomyces subrutilus]|uniref:Uncharacterized protein n=1 Tax=Streptomyces subrutilus TaxID=36818 RepID=A0A918QJJ5_9ACTN|nr:hypothetical protein GCM10010371_06900 [Streptomyces subrutilus]
MVTAEDAPVQVTTTAVAGSPLGLAEGEPLAVRPLPPEYDFFLPLLELEQPPPLLPLLVPPLPLPPPLDENPVSAKTTAISTAVNLIRRPAAMARPLPLDDGGPRYQHPRRPGRIIRRTTEQPANDRAADARTPRTVAPNQPNPAASRTPASLR